MDVLALVAQPTRLEIIRLIWDRELSAGEIAASFELTFGAISQHLRALEAAGVVAARREWRYRYYRARKEALGPLAAYLEPATKPHRVKRAAARKTSNQWPAGWL